MLLTVTLVVLLLLWVFSRYEVWGFEARPILAVFLVLALLIRLVFGSRVRYRQR